MSKKRQTNKTQQKNKRNNLKQSLRTMLAMVMVAVVAIVGTLAYLSRRSNVETNTFLGSPNIDVLLTEPEWTNKEEKRAKDYTPGTTYKKDPKLTNTSDISGFERTTAGSNEIKNENKELDTVAEWVAIKISFKAKGASETDQVQFQEKGSITNTFTNTFTTTDVTNGQPITYKQLQTVISSISCLPAGTVDILTDPTYNGRYLNDFTKSSDALTKDNISTNDTIGGDEEKWVLIQGAVAGTGDDTGKWYINQENNSFIFMYNVTLERNNIVDDRNSVTPPAQLRGNITSNLFDSITILPQNTLADNGYVLDETDLSVPPSEATLSGEVRVLPGFDIVVEGAAIKNETKSDPKNVTEALIKQFGNIEWMYGEEANDVNAAKEEMVKIKTALVSLLSGTSEGSGSNPNPIATYSSAYDPTARTSS